VGIAAASPTQLVAPELDLVEQRLAGLVRSREPLLTEISRYLISSGGKRIRPAVTILVFRACGGQGRNLDDIVDVAAALELIHSASLLHDDIIDGSTYRRGQDSPLQKYGLADTLVAGDFLFGQAYRLCARFEEKLIQWAVQACIALTEGEIMQARFRRNPAVRFDDYMEIITRKTASLFQAGARTAAHLAGADEDVVTAMALCGLHAGLAFQMIDDVLDIDGVEATIGKPVGIDLQDGNPSLPVVLALQDGEEEMRDLFQKPRLSGSEIRTLLDHLRQSPYLHQGHQLALEHARRARGALLVLKDSTYRASLLALMDQLADRRS
jgi:octaprenyl-diphosphate synthase